MEKKKKTLVIQRYLPEEKGMLGSKTTSMLANGSVEKKVKVPFCDYCSISLKEEMTLCSSCQRKICPSCVVTCKNKNYCRKCAKQIVSLAKEECMVLLGIAYELSLKEIKEFSCISAESLRKSLTTLLEKDLIKRHGISVLAHYAVTHRGLSILPTCEQIYQNEGDVQHYVTKVQGFVREN